jgi:hypothetical protein
MVLRQVIRDLASVTAPRNAARYATGNVGDSGSLRNLLRPVDRMPNCCGRAGHWSAWLTEHFRGSKRTSQADMRLAISITLMGGYAQISAHLRHDQLRCLLTGFMAGNWPRTGAPLRHDVVAFNQRLAAAALPKPPLCLLPTAYCLLPTAYCLLPTTPETPPWGAPAPSSAKCASSRRPSARRGAASPCHATPAAGPARPLS